MSFLENLVLDKAWSKRLRDFVGRVQSWNAQTAKTNMKMAQRVDELAADIGFLALLQVATLKLLTDKGILGEGELVPRLAVVDLLDGIEDGSLDISAVRRLIGLERPGQPAKAARGGAAAKLKSRPATSKNGAGRKAKKKR